MDLQLRERAYIVTGGSRGLGLATAKVLVAEGARVLLSARDESRLDAASKEVGSPETVISFAGDIGDPDTAQLLIDRAMQEFGRLDGALVSVGGPAPGSALEYADSEWRAAFETVFLGAVRLARAVSRSLDRGGAVGLILSMSVKSPVEGLVASNALRPGLAMFCKSMADEVGQKGIRVLAFAPGWISTDRSRELDELDADGRALRESIIPLRRYGEPEEFAQAAAFCLSPAASYMTGSVVTIDGGLARAL